MVLQELDRIRIDANDMHVALIICSFRSNKCLGQGESYLFMPYDGHGLRHIAAKVKASRGDVETTLFSGQLELVGFSGLKYDPFVNGLIFGEDWSFER